VDVDLAPLDADPVPGLADDALDVEVAPAGLDRRRGVRWLAEHDHRAALVLAQRSRPTEPGVELRDEHPVSREQRPQEVPPADATVEVRLHGAADDADGGEHEGDHEVGDGQRLGVAADLPPEPALPRGGRRRLDGRLRRSDARSRRFRRRAGIWHDATGYRARRREVVWRCRHERPPSALESKVWRAPTAAG